MSVSASGFFPQVPDLRPALNLGCLMDVPVGRYYTGKHGESILNGGLSYITGVCGRGNAYKSTLAHWMNLRACDRYMPVRDLVYDTEFSLTPARINQLAQSMDRLAGLDLFEAGIDKAVLTDGATMGNDYWEKLKEFGDAKLKEGKSAMLTTPFIVNGKNYQYLQPDCVEFDSLSMMPFDAMEAVIDKASGVDSKDMNVEALRSNLFKNRLLMQMPAITSKYNYYMTCVAHMGDDLALDPMAPPQKKLAFMKQKIKFKQVPEKFTFLTNNLYYCFGATVFHAADKTPNFPKNPEDKHVGDTDLQLIQVQNLRAKSGPSGLPFHIVVSQSEGLLPSLTELYYLRNQKKVANQSFPQGFGIDGNDRSYYLDMLPDMKISRTTARSKTEESYILRRGLEVTSELCQMLVLWKDLDAKYRMTPKELVAKLTERGYKMEELLDTRGYWAFEEDPQEKQFLSTMDMLKMANDEYHPYWMAKK